MGTLLLLLGIVHTQILLFRCQELDFRSLQREDYGYEELRIAAIKQAKNMKQRMDIMATRCENQTRTNLLLKKKLHAIKSSLDSTTQNYQKQHNQMKIIKTFIDVTSDTSNTGIVHIFEDKVFFISRFYLNWDGSQTFCHRMNSSLLNRIDARLNSNMKNMLNNVWSIQDSFWIGAYGSGYSWYWKTNAGAERVTWSDWAPNEPNSLYGNNNCVQMWRESGYRWDDTRCSDTRKFVCARSFLYD